jgi:hypothetical protein
LADPFLITYFAFQSTFQMKKKYLEDLKEIRNIMNQSTRFISLSGLSGVSTGIIGLTGVSIAYWAIFKDQGYLTYQPVDLNSEKLLTLLLIATGTLILSVGSAILFTTQKTKRQNQRIWDHQTKRLLLSLFIPLLTGGLVCLIFLYNGFIGILIPLTLIFYGLALLNSSKYTLPEIKSLGLIEITTGLIAMLFINYGLLFWAFGFGIMQIVYGAIIQIKYKL